MVACGLKRERKSLVESWCKNMIKLLEQEVFIDSMRI